MAAEHIIKSYDDELTRLTGEIVRMGELAVGQLESAIDVIERRDQRAAQHVVGNDDAIDLLEQEISQNAWLTVAADPDVLFAQPPDTRLPAAMKLLGIDFSRLSGAVGHA